MITSDIELFKILENFKHDIPVFRDFAKDKTKSPYIVYCSLTSEGVYCSGKIFSTITEYEILLVQKNKNDISLKNSFIKYLTLNDININGQSETTSIEKVDEYYFLNIYTSLILE